jgi:hypothetical protein
MEIQSSFESLAVAQFTCRGGRPLQLIEIFWVVSVWRLKLACCPHSLAPTLVTLPSMSLIPSAPLQGAHTANIFQK